MLVLSRNTVANILEYHQISRLDRSRFGILSISKPGERLRQVTQLTDQILRSLVELIQHATYLSDHIMYGVYCPRGNLPSYNNIIISNIYVV